MADLTRNNVITIIKQKVSSNNYDDYPIGPELRYVGALPTSNNNNFEEELLLGEDKDISTYIEEENDIKYKYQIIKYKRDNDKNYYVLNIKEKIEKTSLVKFEGKYMQEKNQEGEYIDPFPVFSLCLEYTDNVPSVDAEEWIKKVELWYYKENLDNSVTKILISTRTVYQSPKNDQGEVLTKEEIVVSAS